MRDKLNQFIANLNGQFVEVSSHSALYQCMDLAYLWVFCLGFPKSTIQNQYAHQVYTNPKEITYEYFEIIPNTPSAIPEDGDLVVWKATSSNPVGHIAIALGGGTTRKFMCFEQNSPLGTPAHISERTYTGVLGWLRPKLPPETPAIPSWFLTLLQEANLSLEREGEFRAFWEKARRYDQDILSLQEQLKSANEVLAEKSMEVSDLVTKNQSLQGKIDALQEQLYKTQEKVRETELELAKVSLRLHQMEQEGGKLQEMIDDITKKYNALKIDYSKLEKKSIDAISTPRLIGIILARIIKRG